MALEVEGVITHILDVESGISKAGNAWQKRSFVIETLDQYPKPVCFSMLGDKVSEIENLNTGDKVNVSFNVQSREYQGKWYTDVSAWRIQKSDGNNQFSGQNLDNLSHIPEAQEGYKNTKESLDDDLPF